MKKSDLEYYNKMFDREEAFENTDEYKHSLEEELKQSTTPERSSSDDQKDDIPF